MKNIPLHVKKSFSIIAIFLFLFSNVAFIQPVFAENTISVNDAITNNEGTESVEGYIVGYVISQNNVTTDPNKFEAFNFALAAKKDEIDVEEMLFVQVTTDFRDQFSLETNPSLIGEKVTVTGSLEKYHGRAGLKDPSEIFLANEEGDPENPEEPELTEPISISEAHANPSGDVTVKGVVTAKLKNTIQVQDETGALAVRPTSLNVAIGDEVTVHGTLSFYNKLLQLNDAELLDKHGQKDVIAKEITSDDLGDEIESQLVTLQNISLTNDQIGDGWANFTATDAGGKEFIVRDETGALDLEVGVTYDSITGIVIQFNDDFQVVPRNNQDIVQNEGQVRPVYATPGAGSIPEGSGISLTTLTEDANIYYTVDGSEPTEEDGILYDGPIVINEETTIKAIALKENFDDSEVTTFAYTVYDAEAGIQIHDIQGDKHESPLAGSTVQDVEGVVTYKYDIRGANYFHLQAEEENYDGNKDTSEAIIVYTGREEDIDVGDKVEVSGQVDEYYIDGYDDRAETDLSVTQINARDDRGGAVEIMESDVPLPAPVTVTSSEIPDQIIGEDGFNIFDREANAIDYWESIEGMRVEIPPAKAVGPQEHGDVVVVTDEFPVNTVHGGIRLIEGNPNAQFIQYKLQPNTTARDFKVKTGDMFTESITGVVNYGFQNYKVYADLEDLEDAFKEGSTQPQTTSIAKDEDKLSIAAYNVENFTANTAETSKAKADNIARAIVKDMEAPDIVGLIEMQDNNGMEDGPEDADATETFERLIQVVEDAGGPTYDYVNINPNYNEDGGAPNSNIRVGFIYNTDRVSLVDGSIGSANETVGYEDGELTLNPGRVGPNEGAFEGSRKPLAAQFEFKGETVVAIANHLNSKLGDEALFGQNQPPVFGSEEQRAGQAKILNDFITDIQTDNPDENVVVLGDMNDYEFSNAVSVLKGDVLTNLIDLVPEDERYTYVYQGNSQVLDHIMVSNNLAETSEIDILHVNADFTPMHNRASDHDPVLAQINLTPTEDDEEDGKGSEEENENNEEEKENGENGNDDGDSEEEPNGNEVPSDNGEGTNDGGTLGEVTDDENNKGESGSILPSTATPMYTFILIGSILLASGTIIYIIRKVRVQ